VSSAPSLQTAAAVSRPRSNSGPRGLVLQRKCACGSSTSSLTDECADCKSRKWLQARLATGPSKDPLELEADRVASQVISTRLPDAVHAAPLRVQRLASPSSGQAGSAPASVERALASPGHPLEHGLRSDLEMRFGRDFSSVRIHRGDDAEKSARDVNASAYTVGRHIVFGAGSYAPHSEAGRRLLAHELAHTLQQEGQARGLQRALAGGCAEPADTWPEAMEESSLAGIHAHDQIQEKFFPQLDIEAELPRATKKRQGKACPEKTREPGELDLWRSTGGRSVQIGEIKSVNSEATGRDEVQHYLLRYRQMIERLTGGGCYETSLDEKDQAFVSKWLHRQLKKDELPEAVALNSVVPTAKTLVGVYRGNPGKTLYCKRVQGGVVVYWCNKNRRRKQSDQDDEKRVEKRDSRSARADAAKESDLTLPAIIGTGLALLGSVAAVHWPRATPSPTVKPSAPTVSTRPQPRVQAPKPAATTPRRPHQRPPRIGAGTKAGAGVRGHRPGPGVRAKPPRAGARGGGRAGGIRAPRAGSALRAGGALLGLLALYDAYKTVKGAKADIDAMRGPYAALWDEFEKQRVAGKADDESADTRQPTPVSSLAQPDPEPQNKPAEEKTRIRVFEVSRFRLTEREASVSSASIGTTWLPIEFLSLTRPGDLTTGISINQIDCSRIDKGIAGVSGYQRYTGYARATELKALNRLFAGQIDLARLACLVSGRGRQAAAQPDGDEISVMLLASGESVSAACKTPVGQSASDCSSEGDFASMKALMDDPELEVPPDFFLEVTLVRTRNGESRRSDRTVSVWVDNPDHPAPEPNVQADGSVPADAVDWKAYPSGSDIAYLLELYSRWGR
jgi:hypothetical protein